MQPDVIVAQGTWARDAIAGAFAVVETGSCPTTPKYRVEVIAVGRRRVLKIEMTHPTARMGLYQQEARDA